MIKKLSEAIGAIELIMNFNQKELTEYQKNLVFLTHSSLHILLENLFPEKYAIKYGKTGKYLNIQKLKEDIIHVSEYINE